MKNKTNITARPEPYTDTKEFARVTTGNTMAPCVIIGERTAEVLRAEHKL